MRRPFDRQARCDMRAYPLPLLTDSSPTHPPAVGRAFAVLRRALRLTWTRIRAVTPNRWLLLLFGLLLFTFIVVLLFEPTVGRGGR